MITFLPNSQNLCYATNWDFVYIVHSVHSVYTHTKLTKPILFCKLRLCLHCVQCLQPFPTHTTSDDKYFDICLLCLQCLHPYQTHKTSAMQQTETLFTLFTVFTASPTHQTSDVIYTLTSVYTVYNVYILTKLTKPILCYKLRLSLHCLQCLALPNSQNLWYDMKCGFYLHCLQYVYSLAKVTKPLIW